jgi:hypothetical protein
MSLNCNLGSAGVENCAPEERRVALFRSEAISV